MTTADCEQEADRLFAALKAGDMDAAWKFKWEHPRFRDQTVDTVKPETLTMDDARLVVAHQHAFNTWADLLTYVETVSRATPMPRRPSIAAARPSGTRRQRSSGTVSQKLIVCICISGKCTSP